MTPWSFTQSAETTYLRCTEFNPRGLRHGFGLRHDDVGPAQAPSAAQLRARSRLVDAIGCGHGPELRLHQVHGVSIGSATECREAGLEADGLWATSRSIPQQCLAVRSADCVPLLLATQDGRFVAAVHAGWRGTREAIARRAVERLVQAGAHAADLTVAIGPAIRGCCYEVAEQVASAVAAGTEVSLDALVQRDEGSFKLDLQRANELQLCAAGVAHEAIYSAPWCTACHPEHFFSYRRDAGVSGRHLSLIGPDPGRP